METTTCAWYIAEQLGSRLQPGQVVVLDNLSVHKAVRIRHALQASARGRVALPAAVLARLHADRAGVLQAQGDPARAGARPYEAFVEAMHVAVEAIIPAPR